MEDDDGVRVMVAICCYSAITVRRAMMKRRSTSDDKLGRIPYYLHNTGTLEKIGSPVGSSLVLLSHFPFETKAFK
jgi:hypothetical protein